MPPPRVPAGWMHAVVMQFQVLPPFMFGFLLTVFPRWMNLPPLTRWHYLPIGLGLLGGQLLTFGWREGMDEKFSSAPAFYMVVGTAMASGVAMDFANLNPVKALYWTAIINGLLAPFLLTGILLAASDRRLMGGQPSSGLGRVIVALTTVFMFAAAVAMFVV